MNREIKTRKKKVVFTLNDDTKTGTHDTPRTWRVDEISPKYRPSFVSDELPKVKTSKEVHKYLSKIFDEDWIGHHEEFWVLYLNTANRIIGTSQIGRGGICGTVGDPKIIFQGALICNAVGIVIAHNHPSGNLSPSNSDIELTRRIREGAKLLDMHFLDHVIVAPGGKYYSFADEGLT